MPRPQSPLLTDQGEGLQGVGPSGIGHRTHGTLVIQTAHLGDVVLTLPLLTRLAEQHGPVDLVVTPAAFPLVETHPAVRRGIPFDKHASARGFRGLLGLGGVLRANEYSQVYLPHGSLRSAALAWLSRAPERLGFAGAPGSFLYTTRIPKPGSGHMTERLLALAGNGPRSAGGVVSLTAMDHERAERWLVEHDITTPFLVLAPGARWGTKRWPYFGELASYLESDIVVVGGPEDIAMGEAIVGRAGGRASSAAGALSLRESAAVIERAALVVSNDSLALHLAGALGRPVVALFGPTAPAFGFGPAGAEDIVVEHPSLSCRPCSEHGPATCPLGHHRCMRELDPRVVKETVTHRLVAIAGSVTASGARSPGRGVET